MKKLWGWILGIVMAVAFAVYVFWNGSGSVASVAPGTTTGGNGGATGTPAQIPTPMPTPAPNGAYKDGAYTGPVTDAVYGQVQVVATISGGKLTNVATPVYPNAPGHTTEVNAMALPQLKQEAIAAQSANVDIVSGATQTSQAFQQSLAAALAAAKN